MDQANHLFACTARYTPAHIPHFMGNPLIEALPPAKDDTEIMEDLISLPAFDPSQRNWSNGDRIHMLGTLGSFMLPQTQHVKLCYSLDSMLRRGYVGRAPRTPQHAAISQLLYDMQQGVVSQRSLDESVQPASPHGGSSMLMPAISAALIGISGMGKTTTVRRFCAQLPEVIFHPSSGAYQIPTVHIELPADGANVKGLCISIIAEIDRRIPGSDYMKTFASARLSEERLIHAAAHLMHLHLVGLLICDEVQNLANAKRGAQILMTQLVSLSNISRIPILWIGTNKSVQVLGVDFRQARRSTGEGLAPWDRLHELGEEGEDGELTGKGSGEWEAFLAQLWKYQWLRKPVELEANPAMAAYMYWASQGVIDVAIKFFSACQTRAMLDETEELTLELMDTVYEEEFSVLHPLLEALRSNDLEALSKYDDIAPLDWAKHLDRVQAKIKARAAPMYKVKASDGSFRARIVGSLTAGGVTPELANDAADYVAKQSGCTELVQAIKAALEFVTLPKPARRNRKVVAGSKVKKAEVLDPTRFDDRPGDYRQAFAHAGADGVKAAQQLVAMGMAPQVEDFIEI